MPRRMLYTQMLSSPNLACISSNVTGLFPERSGETGGKSMVENVKPVL